MKKIKHTLIVIVTVFLVTVFLPVAGAGRAFNKSDIGVTKVNAEMSGTWGTCHWTIDSNGVLTIGAGTGVNTYCSSPWEYCRSLITSVKTDGTVVLPSDSSCMFEGCSNLTTADLSGFDTSQVTDMSLMFGDCFRLQHIYVTDKWSTSAVKYGSNMFRSDNSLHNFSSSASSFAVTYDHAYIENAIHVGGGYLESKANKISFDANGGSGSTASVSATIGNAMPSITNGMSRTGYTFAGYYDAASGGTKYYNADGSSAHVWDKAANTTLYAHWQAHTTNVTLDMQGGIQKQLPDCTVSADGSTEKFTTTYDSDNFYIRNGPSRTGYTFQGYYTKPNGQGVKVYGANTRATADGTYWTSDNKWHSTDSSVTFYAYWKANQYTVTCEDWLVDASNNRKVKLGSATKLYDYGTTAKGSDWGSSVGTEWNNQPYYQSYWYKSCTSATVGTSGATVYRCFWAWTDLNVFHADGALQSGATVSFKVGNGTWSDVTNEINTVQPYGTTYYLKNIRPIHEYEEFSRVENLTYDSTNGYYTCTPTYGGTSMNVYLKYKTYSLAYNLNGGSVSGNPTTYNYSTASFTLKNPTKTGYTFIGWTGSNGTTPQTAVTIPSGSYGNRNYTANWRAHTITTKIDINGGTPASDGSQNPVVRSYDGKFNSYGLSNAGHYTSGKTGYHATGVYHVGSANGSITVKEDGQFLDEPVQNYASYIGYPIEDKDQSVTLYTEWAPNSYTVKFDANGGSGTTANETMTYDTAKTLTANSFKRTGYTFSGWNTQQDGTGKTYSDKQSVSNLTSTNNGTVTLYAKWTINTYTVTYNLKGGINSSKNPSTYTVDDAVTLSNPAKDGYAFAGWAEGSQIAKGSTGDKTFTAKWKPIMKVSFTDGTSPIKGASALIADAVTGNTVDSWTTDGTVHCFNAEPSHAYTIRMSSADHYYATATVMTPAETGTKKMDDVVLTASKLPALPNTGGTGTILIIIIACVCLTISIAMHDRADK